jgi:hypothetical protein
MDYKKRIELRKNEEIDFYLALQKELSESSFTLEPPYTIKIRAVEEERINFERGMYSSALLFYKGQLVGIINPNFKSYGDVGFDPEGKFWIQVYGVFSQLADQLRTIVGNTWTNDDNADRDKFHEEFYNQHFDSIQECIDYIQTIGNKLNDGISSFLNPNI